nr:helix-turn-helix domain-containing protein [Kibdelosporangium sp. MJ126-NF4]CEL18634.1 Regulator of polyketide synthase expression [Kibdelosporangium sp. MJ126-NF4]CTQ98119.1 Regulator of polyketide synthase expression [Kibdelosporangium sp. MJ126-NF4]
MDTAVWRGLITTALDRQELVTRRIVAKARGGSAAYARLDEASFAAEHTEIIRFLLTDLVGQRRIDETELGRFRQFGALRARQGIGLEELLWGTRIAIREQLTELTDIGHSHNLSAENLLTMTYYVLDICDHVLVALTTGHQQADRERARVDEHQRADFTRAVLLGTLGVAELGVRAQRYGLDPEAAYVPFRARQLSAVQPLTPPGAFTATIDGDVAGFAGTLTRTGCGEPVGTGPGARLDHLAGSFAQATRALHTAVAFGKPGVHELADLGLLPTVLADAETGDILVRRYLTPVHDAALRVTLRTYLETGQHVEDTATRLIVHPNTIRYRLKRYQELTGVDLSDPDATLELWWALRRAELTKPTPPDTA